MLFQEAPAETLDYMIFGFAVILGSMAVFIVSLVTRFRNLQRDIQVLDEVQKGANVTAAT